MSYTDQLKENKKALYTVTCLIAAIPAVYFYLSKVQEIKDTELALRNDTQSLELQLASHQKKQNTLPELKAQLEKKKQDLVNIESLLPSNVSIQKTLEIITRLSKHNHVILKTFDQLAPVLSPEKNYYEIPLNISLTGTYRDLVMFYDRLTHTKQLLKLTNLRFSSSNLKRDYLTSTCSIILYRGL